MDLMFTTFFIFILFIFLVCSVFIIRKRLIKKAMLLEIDEDLKNLDSRIQIWTLDEIIVLLNAHLGSNWNKRLRVFIKSKDDK